MKFLFLDDTKQRRCPREGMNDLIGVGGVVIDAEALRTLEANLEALMRESGFPDGAIFKWSPRRTDWMYENLQGNDRTQFVNAALELCLQAEANFLVAVVETERRFATENAEDHETDALNLALERFDTFLGDEHGVVFVAKPSGGPADEERLLADCVELRRNGTGFVDFESLAMNVVTIPFRLSRVLQCADLVAAITVSMVAGQVRYADNHFETIREGFLQNRRGQIGGTGLKIHPDYIYANLYHWLLGDQYLVRGNAGTQFPIQRRAFAQSADER